MQLPSILFLLSLSILTLTQQIIDYSHTASIQRTQRDSSKTYDISISPPQPTTESFEFPYACSRTSELLTNQLVESDKLPLGSHEEMLNRLKRNMTRLLSLSEDIKLLRLELAEIEKELPKETEKEPLSGNQVEQLSQLEENLFKINSTIEEKVRALGDLITQELNRTKDNGFSELRLGFQLSLYEARLRYLQDLKKSHKNEKEGNSDVKINDYFNQIQREARTENKQLGDLYDLLDNFAVNSALKLKISNELKKLEAKNYIIEDKQQCRINTNKPINPHNEHNIDQITAQLRILKKIQSPNREHCEGVALKLLNQIKKVLRAYNYSYVCAEGLEELKEQKKQIELKLASLYKDYNNVEYDPIFKKIQEYFNKSIDNKDKLIHQVFTFTFNQHSLNIPALEAEISHTLQKIQKIKYQIQHPPSSNSKPFDHEAVRNKIKEINEQQFKYCSIKEDYEGKYRVLERLVRNYEFKVEQSIQKNTFFLEKVEKLRKVQGEFNQIRRFLLLAIE